MKNGDITQRQFDTWETPFKYGKRLEGRQKMSRERNYDRSETWELLERLEELIGTREVLDNLCMYLSSDTVADALTSIATNFDVKSEMLEVLDR